MTPESPTPDLIQQTTETVGRFIKWIAELIRHRNWFMLLVLIGVALAFLGSFFQTQVNNVLPDTLEGKIWTIVWTVTVLCFLAALAVATATMPRSKQETVEDTVERKAIKGLRPFSREDAAVFAQLQREVSLRECCDAVTSDGYKFGILMGESGCGKTSFLQAGLGPKLTEPNTSHRAVYVRFSEQEAFETIRKALAEQLEMPLDWLKESFFTELLIQATEAAGKPIVLLLDQFEQFFVHNQRKEDRAPFVNALTAWYQNRSLDNVKLLISIRADLLHELYELHAALQYSLGPHDLFKLERFTPQEATKILAVIAETEQLEFDSRFVTELAEQELSHRENGTISPVDLQILAWMITKQKSDDLRAFNRTAFQKFGGVEGLLTRFLERMLDARVLENQRQAAIKTLLALTDLDRQVRAGSLTLLELQTKLKNTVKPNEVEESVTWLARSDVRLITPQDKDGDGTYGYELAHERLIPALMRLAGKELTTADKANQLLERRVNEWLGNQKNSRYLLGWRELWLIRQQKPYLVWGAKRKQKEKLIHLSQRKIYRALSFGTAVVLAIGTFYVWLNFTMSGQIQQVRWALSGQIERVSDESTANIATALIKDGIRNNQYSKGINLIREHIESRGSKASAIQEIVKISTQISDIRLLEMALDIALEIDHPEFKSAALSAISKAHSQLGDEEQAQLILKQTLETAKSIDDPFSKFNALKAIADVLGYLENKLEASQLLEEALEVAESIDDPFAKSNSLNVIAAAYGKTEEIVKVQSLTRKVLETTNSINDPYAKSNILSDIAGIFNEIDKTEQAQDLLNQALEIAGLIENPFAKFEALSAVFNTLDEIKDKEQVKAILGTALSTVKSIDDSYVKSYTLQAITSTAGKIEKTSIMPELLTQILETTELIEDPHQKSIALSITAISYSQLEEQAQQLLEQALKATNSVENQYYDAYWAKADALRLIAVASQYLEEADDANKFLEQILEATESIDEPYPKSSVLGAVASTASQFKETDNANEFLEQVLEAIESIDESYPKSNALRMITTAAGQLNDVHFAKEILIKIRKIAERVGASDILGQVASYQALYGDWKAALTTLRTCLEADRTSALAKILTHHVEDQVPKLIDGPVILDVNPTRKSSGQYKLSVTIQSPDESCSRYADWWEVLSKDGSLLGRHIITTPHEFEKPFTTDMNLAIAPKQTIIVRAHFSEEMNKNSSTVPIAYRNLDKSTAKYTTQAMEGQVDDSTSFKYIRLPISFAAHVENQGEQPQECQIN